MWILLQASCSCWVLSHFVVCCTALPCLQAKARHEQGTVRCMQAL